MIRIVDLDDKARQVMVVAACDELSILEIDPANNKASRVYSTLEAVFPLYGKKDLPENTLTRRLVFEKDVVFSVGKTQIQAAFPDSKRILDEGINAIVNVPIVQNARAVGSLNCMYRDEAADLPPAHEFKRLQLLFANQPN